MNSAIVGLDLPGDHFKNSTFPRSVLSHERDLVSFPNIEGRPIQDDDDPFVETIYQASQNNTSILDLVLLTVELDSFRYRGAE